MSKQLITVIVLIVSGVVIAEFPGFQSRFLIPITEQHPHLLVLVEGVVGIILACWASKRDPAQASGGR